MPVPWEATDRLQALVEAAAERGYWVASRKEALVELIRRGALTEAQACATYGLSSEELSSWRRRDQALGRRGHLVTKIQENRRG
jgi:hypothetical protein